MNKLKNSLLHIIFLSFNLLIVELFAQTPEIDSLNNLLHKQITKDSVRVKLLNEAVYKLYTVDIDKAIQYANEAHEISLQIQFKEGIANSLNLLGICFDEKSDYPKALDYYHKALKIFEELSDKNGITKCYNNIGVVYRIQGDYSRALDYYKKSLKIDEEIDNKSGASYSLNNIGIIYWYQGYYPKSLEYFQKSLDIDEELGDKSGVSNSLNNIGIAYEYQNNYPKALEYYQKSLRLKEELKNNSGIAAAYSNIGTIFLHQQQYSKAYEAYQKTLEVSLKIKKKSSEIYSYVGFAKYFLALGNANEAYKYSMKAYRLAEEIGNAELIKESSELLAKSSSDMGDYEEAYKYHVLFKTMNDSLFNEKNIKKVTGLEYQFQFEKERREAELIQLKKDAIQLEKEKRQKIVRNTFITGFILMFFFVLIVINSFLQKRNANRVLAIQKEKLRERNAELFNLNEEIQLQSNKINAANQNLRILNATKDKFFSIIAHDLRSPFNSLLGLSEILLKRHKEYDIQEREEIIKSFNSSILGTYKLLENLLTWSLSQSGRIQFSPEKLNLKELLRETIIDLQESANKKNIQIINTISENEIVYADKNMISTVLRNLITNAIKFTKSGQQITSSAKKQTDDKFYEISITDTGVGIPKEKINDLFCIDKNTSTKGTDNEKGTGLGLILCKEFVEKHGGEIWVESEVKTGTTFSFSIPNIQNVK